MGMSFVKSSKFILEFVAFGAFGVNRERTNCGCRVHALFSMAMTVFSVIFSCSALAQNSSSLSQLRPGWSKSEKTNEISLGVMSESQLFRSHAATNLPSGSSHDVKNMKGDEQKILYRVRGATNSAFSLGAAIEFEGSTSAGGGQDSMEEIPEAYIRWKSAPTEINGATFILGRKLEIWSQLDSEWSLGQWQPLNRFDALRPTEQGLAGVFANWKRVGFEVVFFASPIFLPEQGPAVQTENGRLRSSNPWFSEPPDKMMIGTKETEMRYAIERPTNESVINHPEAALALRFGEMTEAGGNVQISYAKKPRNQVSLPFDGVIDINKNLANVRIVPIVEYHDLYGIDSSYRGNWGTTPTVLSFSGLYDIAVPSEYPMGTTYQKFAPLLMLSASAEARLFPEKFWGPKVKLSGLHSIGGEISMHGPLASEENPFGSRTIYREAASIDVRSRIWRSLEGWKLEQGIRVIEEFAEQGLITMVDLTLSWRKKWRLSGYVDLLSSQQPSENNPGFISRFRGNDRVGTQLRYVF